MCVLPGDLVQMKSYLNKNLSDAIAPGHTTLLSSKNLNCLHTLFIPHINPIRLILLLYSFYR